MELARGVAGDAELLAFLAELPQPKRQPNLLFARSSYLVRAPPRDWREFRALGLRPACEIARADAGPRARRPTSRRVARSLLPLLATLPQPLALIEVGASAGCACTRTATATTTADRVPPSARRRRRCFACAVDAPMPLPARGAEVVWRAGIDLNPLDVTDADDVRWLQASSGPAHRPAGAAARRRSRSPPPTRRACFAATSASCAAGRAGAPPRRRWSCSTPPCWPTSPQPGSAFGSARRSVRSAPRGSRTRAPQVFDADGRSPGRDRGGSCSRRDGHPVAWTDSHGAAIDWLG